MFNDIYRNKKVLITGHTGFKGSWLTIWLSRLGAKVVGVSNNVGRPMALELLLEKCTVTSCHSKTKDLEGKVRQADLVVVAAGRQNLVRVEWIKKGAIVIDIGINRINELVSDVSNVA